MPESPSSSKSPSLEIQIPLERLNSRARQLTLLTPEELRRQTFSALRDLELDFLWELTESYLFLHSRTISPHTLRAYKTALKQFLEGANFDLFKAPRDAGVVYVRALEDAGLKPKTLQVKLAALGGFYKALKWARLELENPFENVKARPDRESAAHKRKPYLEDELGAMLQVAEPLEGILLLLCGHGGLRISEALALIGADIDLEAGEIRVRLGKGGRERFVPISAKLEKALGAGIFSKVDRIFPWNYQQIRYRMEKLQARAGIDKKFRLFHALRHYAGTTLMRKTRNLVLVKEHLGHSNINTTSIYAKLVDDELKSAVRDM